MSIDFAIKINKFFRKRKKNPADFRGIFLFVLFWLSCSKSMRRACTR